VNDKLLFQLQIFYFFEPLGYIQGYYYIWVALEEQLLFSYSIEEIFKVLFEEITSQFSDFLHFVILELAKEDFVPFSSFLDITEVLVVIEKVEVLN